jgi:hypothetical protein
MTKVARRWRSDEPVLSVLRAMLAVTWKEVSSISKPSKSALSKAGRTLSANSSSKAAKKKAGSTLGKG